MRLILVCTMVICHTVAAAQDLGLESIAPEAGLVYSTNIEKAGLSLGLTTCFGEILSDTELFPAVAAWSDDITKPAFKNFQIRLETHYYSGADGFYPGLEISMNYLTKRSAGTTLTELLPGAGVILGYEYFTKKYIWFAQTKFVYISGFKTALLTTGFFFDIYK